MVLFCVSCYLDKLYIMRLQMCVLVRETLGTQIFLCISNWNQLLIWYNLLYVYGCCTKTCSQICDRVYHVYLKFGDQKKLEVFLIKLCRCNLKAYRTSISCLYDRLRTEKFSFCRSKCNYNSLYCLFVKVIVLSYGTVLVQKVLGLMASPLY